MNKHTPAVLIVIIIAVTTLLLHMNLQQRKHKQSISDLTETLLCIQPFLKAESLRLQA